MSTGQSTKQKKSLSGPAIQVTVAELRSGFKRIEAQLARGKRVQVTRRGEVVAEIQAPSVPSLPAALPDFAVRLRKLWGNQPVNVDMTALIAEGRGH